MPPTPLVKAAAERRLKTTRSTQQRRPSSTSYTPMNWRGDVTLPGARMGGGSPRHVSGERESSLADPHGGPAATVERKRLLSGDTPGGRCCLSFPMRTLGLRPCIPWEGEAIQSKIATCSFQTVQAMYFSTSRMTWLSRYRRQGYPKCPKGFAWAGWQGRWYI